jgi:murein DD-endopeptidase MepM/ murein hydrolase activator NlpD
MFPTNNNVTLALRLLGSSTGAQYADTTGADAGPSAGQIISVNIGAAAPGAEMSVSLKVPTGFPSSGFTPRLFVKFMWDDSDETLDSFEPIDSVYNPNTKIVTGTVPVTAFTSLRNADGTVECLVLVGSVATSALDRAALVSTTDPCPLELFAPIHGLSRDQLHVTSPFGFRIHPITGLPEGHKGTDITAGNETNVVAAASGQIVRIGFDQTVKNGHIGGYGQYVLIRHPDGSETRYGHLEAGSVDLANARGLDYPKRPGRGPLYLDHPIDLTGGTSRIGTMDTTGGATARHLHFEYSTGSITGTGLRDPFPCITLPPPDKDPWNGSWVGRYNASHGGACNWTDDGNVTIVVTANGTSISGSMSVDGLEVRNLSTCEIVGYDSASGDANGTKTDTRASINYTVTDNGLDPGPFSGSMSLMRNGNSISGTITILGGTGPITLTKQ